MLNIFGISLSVLVKLFLRDKHPSLLRTRNCNFNNPKNYYIISWKSQNNEDTTHMESM